jgi:hypothetical protein
MRVELKIPELRLNEIKHTAIGAHWVGAASMMPCNIKARSA